MSGSTAEPLPHALVRAQREGCVRYSERHHYDGLWYSQDVISIVCGGVCLLTCTTFMSSLLLFSWYYPNSSLYFSFLSDVLAADSDLRSAMLAAKILRISISEILLSRTTALAKNGRRRTEFSNAQSRILSKRVRFPTAM